jgi:hypothetical protein
VKKTLMKLGQPFLKVLEGKDENTSHLFYNHKRYFKSFFLSFFCVL